MLRRTFLAGAGALSALGPQRASAAFGDAQLTAQVSFACVVPLTGPNLRDGEQIANGVRQAISDANRLRGPIEKVYGFRTFDDQNLIASGILEAQFAVDDTNMIGAIGHLSGKVTDQALQVYANARMALVVPASTYERITMHGARNVFRLPTKDSTEGRLAAKYVGSLPSMKKFVVLVQDGDYGNDVAAGFREQAQADKLDVRIVSFPWEKPNFTAAARDALASTPDMIYLAGNAGDMGPVIPALRSEGYKGNLAASQGFFNQATIERFGATIEGIVVSSSMPPLYLAPSAYRIKRDYEARYGPMTPLAAFGYSATQIVIGAVKRSGGFDRASVARTIATGGPYDTVAGSFAFNFEGDTVDPQMYFYTVKDAKWAYLKAAHPSAFILK